VCRSGEKDSNLPGSDNLRAPQTQRSAGTILVRSFLIAAGVLLAGTLCAHANLGESFIDANKRWGLPVVECSLPNGYKAIYGCHGWVITQIWDHTNVAVAVIYYHPWTGGTRLNEFTKNQLAALWLNNTRGEGQGVHWICSPQSTRQLMIWSSPELQTEVHLEIIASGAHWVHCLSFVASPAAAELLLEFQRMQ
jgi:hypothetical protein